MTTYDLAGAIYWNAQQTSVEHLDVFSFTVTRGREIHYRQDGFWLLLENERKIIGHDLNVIAHRLNKFGQFRR